MKISVPSLSSGRHEFRSRVPPHEYGEAARASGLEFVSPVDVTAVVDTMGEELYVRADAEAAVHAECARCLEAFDLPLAAYSQALHVPESERESRGSRTARAESESQRILYYSGGVVDLAEQIVESLALAIPMKPICGDACKGLCPHCGANLNTAPCTCTDDDDFGHPFKGLFGAKG